MSVRSTTAHGPSMHAACHDLPRVFDRTRPVTRRIEGQRARPIVGRAKVAREMASRLHLWPNVVPYSQLCCKAHQGCGTSVMTQRNDARARKRREIVATSAVRMRSPHRCVSSTSARSLDVRWCRPARRIGRTHDSDVVTIRIFDDRIARAAERVERRLAAPVSELTHLNM